MNSLACTVEEDDMGKIKDADASRMRLIKDRMERARRVEFALPQCLRVLDELGVDAAEPHAYDLALKVRAYKADPAKKASDMEDVDALLDIANGVDIGEDVIDRAELLLEVLP